jgi:hypothetical protein
MHLLLNDERMWIADPTQTLSVQLHRSRILRISSAKLLTHTSLCFTGVPLEAIDLFIQLVADCDIPEGRLMWRLHARISLAALCHALIIASI